tara:strand:+ start:46 stop:276 length:231 start_codon:yes stop_codon:yes gene_type:complete
MFSLDSPFSIAVASVILGLIIVFIYNKTKKNEAEKSEYLKISILLFIVSYLISYLNNNSNHINQSGGKIMTGSPSF